MLINYCTLIHVGLGDCDTPVSGSTVYGFQTPKRHGALAQAGEFACNYNIYYQVLKTHLTGVSCRLVDNMLVRNEWWLVKSGGGGGGARFRGQLIN